MKIIENSFKEADKLLCDCTALLAEINKAASACRTFAEMRKDGLYKTLPQFVAGTRTTLRECNLKNFSAQYAQLRSAVVNTCEGGSSNSHQRLVAAMYNLGKFNEFIEGSNYMLRSDAERANASSLVNNAKSNFAAFIIGQFGVNKYEKEVYLCVASHCDANNMSPKDFNDILMKNIAEAGGTLYGYEEMSPYYDALVACDISIVSAAEEAGFPLTPELCEKFLDGEIQDYELHGQIMDWQKNNPLYSNKDGEFSEENSPLYLLKNLKLE